MIGLEYGLWSLPPHLPACWGSFPWGALPLRGFCSLGFLPSGLRTRVGPTCLGGPVQRRLWLTSAPKERPQLPGNVPPLRRAKGQWCWAFLPPQQDWDLQKTQGCHGLPVQPLPLSGPFLPTPTPHPARVSARAPGTCRPAGSMGLCSPGTAPVRSVSAQLPFEEQRGAPSWALWSGLAGSSQADTGSSTGRIWGSPSLALS